MEKHKSNALEDDCLCSGCTYRFQCFTQERVFSDPVFQGLFEALIAQGKSRDEAVDTVAKEIKSRMNRPVDQPYSDPVFPFSEPIKPIFEQPWVVGGFDDGANDWNHDHSTVHISVNDDGSMMMNYTMQDGEEISWECK